MVARPAYRGWPAACVVAVAVMAATGARAATGDESAANRLWTAMDNVGALYSVMGQQLVDDLKSNYIKLAGGDSDTVNVPEIIIQDGFLDDLPADGNAVAAQDERLDEAGADETAAPGKQPEAEIVATQPDTEAAQPEAGPPEAGQPETEGADTEIADTDLPKTLPVSSPVRVPPVQTAQDSPDAGTLTLDDATLAQDTNADVDRGLAIENGIAASPALTLEDLVAPPPQNEQQPAGNGTLVLDDITEEEAPAPATELAADEVTATPESVETENAAACFNLVNVTLTGSTLIDQPMTDMMFAGEIGSCITPELIGSALERLNGYFLDAGFVTTRAYITPQDLKTGTLDITVVEGTIEDIRLNDNTAKDKRRIRMAFASRLGDILNINDIDQGLAQMNRPQSVVATLNLVPGNEAGQTIVQIDEKLVSNPVRYKLGVDNSGSQGTGTTKSTLGVDADNLLSMNETISVSHIGSSDTNALAGSVTFPVGRNTIEASSSYSDYLSDVDQYTQIFGRTDSRELKLTRALFKTESGDVKAEVSLAKKSTRRTINDLVLTPQRLTTARAGLKYSGLLANGTALSANLYLAAGTKLLNATRDVALDKTAPRAQFRKLQADGSLTFSQIPGMTTQTTSAGQLAPHPLYSSEQISAGGQKSVRGFKGNAISGDSGFYAQTDVIMPVPERFVPKGAETFASKLQIYGGLDVGAARDLALGKTNIVAGGGGGMRMNFGGFSGELGAGAPIYRKTGSRNNKVETYVKLLYSIAEL